MKHFTLCFDNLIIFYRTFFQPPTLLSGLVLSAGKMIILDQNTISAFLDTDKDPGSCTGQRLGVQMFGGEIVCFDKFAFTLIITQKLNQFLLYDS